MTKEDLLGFIKASTDAAVKEALAIQLKSLLEVEAKELKASVGAGYQAAERYNSQFVPTKGGDLINPLAAKNSLQYNEFGNYWIKLAPDGEIENWVKSFVATIKDQTVSSNTGSGFLVPEEFEASVIQYREPNNIVWPRATIVPMNTDTKKHPKLAQVSVGTVNHFGGVVFNWTEETGTKIETEPKWEQVVLQAKELSAYTQISDTLLADSPINLINFMTDLFRRAWMWTTDKVYIDGDAAGKPLGVIEDPAIITVARQTAGAVVLTDISNMYEQHPVHFMNGAVWFMSKQIEARLLNERSTTNDLLLRNMLSVKDGRISTLKGHPIALSDNKTPTLGTKGDVILGNWREGYYIGRRQGLKLNRSEHVAFLQNMLTLRATGRVAGVPAQPKAFVVLDVAEGGS
jgi:HK97 family phage major capsid protein